MTPDPANSGEMVFAVETITPADAEALLKDMPYVRRVRPGEVKQLVAAILDGRWQLTNQGLALSPDGKLLDGMHRCTAIVRAGVPVQMVVAYNVPESALAVLDTGSKRSFADHLLAHGHSFNYQGEAAAVRLLWHHLRGEMGHSGQYMVPATDQLVALAEKHPQLSEWSGRGRSIGRHIQLPGSAVIVALYVTSISCPDRTQHEDFWGAVSDGAGLGLSDPRLALRRFGAVRKERLAGNSSGKRQIDATVALDVMIRMWNAWLEGKEVKRIQVGDRREVTYPNGWPLARPRP